jgi:ABC-2 type transport system ATP-binding protein
VLFLDEPTTGLDPRSRLEMWSVIRELVSSGTTLLLTTQYLEEADELADDIVVIDHGKVIAAGTPSELKNRIGGDILELSVIDTVRLGEAANAVRSLSDVEPILDTESGRLSLAVGPDGSHAIVETVRRLDAIGVQTEGLGIRRPSLDDVFLSLTGHDTAEATDNQSSARRKHAHS